MDIYILDESLRRTEIVEKFESFIWTERWSAYGDFQLDIDPRLAERSLFSQGVYLGCNKSNRVMVVETTENTYKEDGTKVLVVKGRSLEFILENRPNQYSAIAAGLPAYTQVWGPGTPDSIIYYLVDHSCRINSAVTTDNIPFLQAGTYSTPGSIALPSDSVTMRAELDNLYNSVKNIADIYRIGFRLIRVEDGVNPGKLYFEVYSGFDRTTSQTTRSAVVFSSQLDNLTDTTELVSTAAFKNVAYVYGVNGSRIVYAPGTDPTISGFDKKVLIVDASDIDLAAGDPLNAALDQRGREELAKTMVVIGFDGQIPQNGSYVYGVDYMLGDLVEQRSDDGIINNMRVTEQIFISDNLGERSYPTLTLDVLISTGSWNSIAIDKHWDDYTTETWATL